MPASTDFMVHGDEFAQGYVTRRRAAVRAPAVPALDPQDARRRAARARGSRRAVPRGRARPRRRHHSLPVAQPRRGAGGPVHAAARRARSTSSARGYMLIRVRALPERILALFLGTPGHRRVPARRCERRGRGRLRASDRSRVVPVGVPAGHVPRVLARRSRRRAARAARAVSDIGDLTRVDLELDKPRDPAQHGGGARRADRRRAQARGGDGPAAPRRRDADPDRSTRRGSSGSCSRCRRCRCAAIASRSPIAASSSSARENLDVIPLGQLLCELTPGLLVPLGMDIVPRVSPEVLARALGHRAGVVTVFTTDNRPFQVARGRVHDARAPLAREARGRSRPRRSTTPPSRAPRRRSSTTRSAGSRCGASPTRPIARRCRPATTTK